MTTVLEWLTDQVERETTERPWPSCDVRAHYRGMLHRPERDPSIVFWTLYENSVIRPVELPTISNGPEAGEVDWGDAYYRQKQQLWPPQPCPDCNTGTGGVTARDWIHGAGWQTCLRYRQDTELYPCPHGSNCESTQPGDTFGCLTACCGASWSINDGPPYCKCCYAEIDPSWDRQDIYKMWEAPDLAHYAKRIEDA